MFLHNISTKRLKALQSHYGSNGLTPRVHKNKKRLPHNTTPFSTVQDIVQFLLNLAQEQGLVLPGRVPGYHRTDIQLLPSSTTKLAVWKKYCESCGDSQNLVSRATFTSLWQQLVPQVVIMKPMTDLCWQCQQNSSIIQRSANLIEEDKSDALKKALTHIHHAEQECNKTTTGSLPSAILLLGVHSNATECFIHCHHTAMPQPSLVHKWLNTPSTMCNRYTTLQIPCSQAQSTSTPRKCALFGICCEAIPRELTYLCDEAVDTGKGSNSVVSQLHHFSNTMASGKNMFTCMMTTVQAKIKTTSYCATSSGE